MGKKENELKPNDAVVTPACIYEPILEALGLTAFGLDPCSHPRAIVPVVTQVLLPKYRTPEDVCVRVFADGLTVDWSEEFVWLNPPYSHLQYPKKYPWLPKLANEAERGVAFLPSRTSSGWMHEQVFDTAQAVSFIRGRVKHVGEKWGSPFHQFLAFYGFERMDLARLKASQREQGSRWIQL